MIQDILGQWIVLHFVGISPTTPPAMEDFSYQLSYLQLGKKCLNETSVFLFLVLYMPVFLLGPFHSHYIQIFYFITK
jgi:hypothetical protein